MDKSTSFRLNQHSWVILVYFKIIIFIKVLYRILEMVNMNECE